MIFQPFPPAYPYDPNVIFFFPPCQFCFHNKLNPVDAVHGCMTMIQTVEEGKSTHCDTFTENDSHYGKEKSFSFEKVTTEWVW